MKIIDKIVKLCPADQWASTVSLPLSLTFLGILAANHVQPCIGGELSKLLFSDSIFFFAMFYKSMLTCTDGCVCLFPSKFFALFAGVELHIVIFENVASILTILTARNCSAPPTDNALSHPWPDI